MEWPWLMFKRTEYQDMKNDDVADGVEDEPISVKKYFAKRRVMEAYDTHYLRAGLATSQKVYFEAYKFNFFERTAIMIMNFLRIDWQKRFAETREKTLKVIHSPYHFKGEKIEIKKNGGRIENI